MHEIDPREFDGAAFQSNPFPLYQRLRDHHPAFHDRFHNRWILSRYEDIDWAFQSNDCFDRAQYQPDGPYEFGTSHIFGPNILEYGNSDEHRRLRNIAAGQFVGKKLESFIPMIHQIAEELTESIRQKLSDTGEVDLVADYSSQLPIRVISNMLGLPREDENRFVGWYQALIAGLGFGGEHLARGVQARNEMWAYLDPLIAERTGKDGEDLLSRICNVEKAGSRMTVDEVKGFVALLLAAGGDTTDKAIANMWYHMLYTAPSQLDSVVADSNRWQDVFTEMMRFDAVVHAQFRFTTKELEIQGQVLPERAGVVLYLGAGNRDERVFKNPDQFDIERDDLHFGMENRTGRYKDKKPGHLGFGVGQHFCMGYIMARQESEIACAQLLTDIGVPTPRDSHHPGIVSPSIDSGGFRSPAELWIRS